MVTGSISASLRVWAMVTTWPVVHAISRAPSIETTASGLVAIRSKTMAIWRGRSESAAWPGMIS